MRQLDCAKTLLSIIILIIISLFSASCTGGATPSGGTPGAGGPSSSGTVQIKGSDTMVNLGQAWAEEFMSKNPGVSVSVTGGGSGTGIAALINSTTDIAEASRKMEETEISQAEKNGITPVENEVALDGLAVVVNPSNPISTLTMDQLRDIFMGNVKNWKDVGGNDAGIVILSRESNSGTYVYFREHVLRRGNPDGPEEYAPTALLMPSSQAIADEVASNVNAIGYYGLGYVTPRQKAIAVATASGETGIAPSIDTVLNGTYPISRPLFWYTKGEPTGTVKALLDFVLGPDGQKVVVDNDFVPIGPTS